MKSAPDAKSAALALAQWSIKDFDPDCDIAVVLRDGDTLGWIAATAPGDTYRALAAAGRSGKPFHARHEHDVAWVADRTWCWRTRFKAEPAGAGERVELVFDGLDTFAGIYLNGEWLGRADNMFRAWRFDLAGRLRAGDNELAVVFAPATQAASAAPPPLWPIGSEKIAASKRNLIRKAQFGWGWDWGPRLPTVGIWQPVRIERWCCARITELQFATLSLSEHSATVSVNLVIERADKAAALSAVVTLLDPDGVTVAAQTVSVLDCTTQCFEVAEPRLWWTADLGTQPRYTVAVQLLRDRELLDVRQLRVGIRTIALDTSDDADEPGTQFFRFVLNGVPIFARGACWIPASSFVGAIEPERYRGLLEQAVAANMNMLRVWGGGIYEHDIFYELCDQLGMLVWQDFMFACAPYPDDEPAFVDNVRQEVQHQIKRLRSHPSLALWCGNNECQVLQDLMNQMSGGTASLPGSVFYDQLIPEALLALDPATPYWPGSPAGGPSPNSMRAGDVHDWTVWHGVPPVPDERLVGDFDRSPEGVAYTRYAEDMGRFISEFGIQSAPALASLQRWLPVEDLKLGSAGLLDRIKDEPKDKVDAMLVSVTGLPTTLPQYIDFTMITQAEGLKFGVEHFRRRKPHCSGTLIWQYNDCWPCVSWSLVDYDGVGKAGLYATARAYAPVLASFKQLADGAFELWITNDSLQPITGLAFVELLALAGGCDWCESVAFQVPANTSRSVWRGTALAAMRDRILCVRAADDSFAPNRHLLASIKDLALMPGAAPSVQFQQINAQLLQVTISSDCYLLFVHLTSSQRGLQFSDNYFDLRPAEVRTITVRAEAGTTVSAEAIAARCWNPSVI